MKEIKTANYLKKQAQPLPVGDPGLPSDMTGREIEESGGAFLEQKEDIIYSTLEDGQEPIEITINGEEYNKWLEEVATKTQSKVEAWEVLPPGNNVLKVDFEMQYDQMNEELEESKILKITSYNKSVDLTDISDALKNYEPFMKQWKNWINFIVEDRR